MAGRALHDPRRRSGRRGRSVRSPPRASSPAPTASRGFPTTRPGPGPAPTSRSTATWSCGNPDDRWTVGGALRFERFDVFGATANGKLSARYGLGLIAVSVRGGVSTGFRAPTPGQQNTFNVQSTINPKTLDLVDSATVPSTYRAAQLRGGRPLESRDLDKRDRRACRRHRRLHAHRRLLPRRRREPPRPVAELHARGGRACVAPVRRHHVGAHAGLLPVLHQRLLDPQRRGSTWSRPGRPPALRGNTVFSLAMNYTHTELTEESELLSRRGRPRPAARCAPRRAGTWPSTSAWGGWVCWAV